MTSKGPQKTTKITSNDLKMTSKDKNNKLVSKEVISKNNLRGGDPNDNPTQGSILFILHEKAFHEKGRLFHLFD